MAEKRRFCFYDIEGVGLAKVVEGIAGYRPLRKAFTKEPELFSADELNEALGLTEDDARDIIGSSMFPHSVAADRAKERYGDA